MVGQLDGDLAVPDAIGVVVHGGLVQRVANGE